MQSARLRWPRHRQCWSMMVSRSFVVIKFRKLISVADDEESEGHLNARLLEGVLEVDESNSDDSCKIVITSSSLCLSDAK